MEPVESPVRSGEARDVEAVTTPTREWIAAIEGHGALAGYPARLAATAADLAGAGAAAHTVAQALTGLHDVLTARLITVAEADLGPPPCGYAWLALGSGGRREQSLLTDQDNAIVYADDDPTAGAYFPALGTRVVDGLARAGLYRCPGGYMADRWHVPLGEWLALFRGWVERPEPQALVQAELFLDYRPVYGRLALEAVDALLRRAAGTPRFLIGLARAAVRFPPPIGFAGRIRSERGEVDLKRAGLAPVVLLARLYAMAAGTLARPTTDRLAAAAAAGTLSRSGAEALTDAYEFLAELRLAEQLRQVAGGAAATNRVRLDELTGVQRRRLRQGMRAIRDVQRATALRFHTRTVL